MTNTHTTGRTYLLAALGAVIIAVGVLSAGLLAAETQAPERKAPAGDTTPAGTDDGANTDDGADPAGPWADGKHFGAIGAAYVAPPELVFEARQLLVGDAARAAAASDGVAADDVGDFYVRRLRQPLASLPVDSDVVVTRVDCSGQGCAEGAPTTYDDFTRSFNPEADAFPADARHFWITVDDGQVIRIDEQHMP